MRTHVDCEGVRSDLHGGELRGPLQLDDGQMSPAFEELDDHVDPRCMAANTSGRQRPT